MTGHDLFDLASESRPAKRSIAKYISTRNPPYAEKALLTMQVPQHTFMDYCFTNYLVAISASSLAYKRSLAPSQ